MSLLSLYFDYTSQFDSCMLSLQHFIFYLKKSPHFIAAYFVLICIDNVFNQSMWYYYFGDILKKLKYIVPFLVLALILCFIGFKYRMKDTLKVLTFHSVEEREDFNEYCIDPDKFEEIIKGLKDEGFKFLSINDVRDAVTSGEIEKKSVLITFDDGYADNYSVVLPILKKYDAKATVFVIGSKVGLEGYLTWDNIKEMSRSGCFDFQSHTFNLHDLFMGGKFEGKTFLSAPLEGESDEEYKTKIVNDLVWNNSVIYEHTSAFPFALAYPGSMTNDKVLEAVKEAGIEIGFVGAKKIPGKIKNMDPLNIPRMHVGPKVRTDFLIKYLSF